MDSNKTNIEHIISKVILKQATAEEIHYLQELMKEDLHVRKLYFKIKNLHDVSHPAFSENEIDVLAAEEAVMKRIKNKEIFFSVFSLCRNIAAILAIPLIISTAFLYKKNKESSVGSVAMQEVFAPYGTYSLIILPDSSKVWLNSGTSFKYPLQFSANKRCVELNGEAYFEVEADPENPFIVKTKDIEINAVGTSFNVESYAKDSMTAVTMADGKVNILLDNTHMTSLTQSNRLSFNRISKEYTIEKNTSNKWYAWKDGKMIFRDDPLEQVFKRIGQTYNIDIVITDPEIARHPYRATFEDESLDEILKLLEMTAPIKYIDNRGSKEDDQYEQRKIEVQRLR